MFFVRICWGRKTISQSHSTILFTVSHPRWNGVMANLKVARSCWTQQSFNASLFESFGISLVNQKVAVVALKCWNTTTILKKGEGYQKGVPNLTRETRQVQNLLWSDSVLGYFILQVLRRNQWNVVRVDRVKIKRELDYFQTDWFIFVFACLFVFRPKLEECSFFISLAYIYRKTSSVTWLYTRLVWFSNLKVRTQLNHCAA